MISPLLFCVVALVLCCFPTFGANTTVFLVITRANFAPDCGQPGNVYLINDSYVGPPVHVDAGSYLSMTISNQNDSPLSIHLHGLLQKDTPASDGASYISSSPLAPWETRTLISKVGADEAGTFFYHAHHDLEDMHVFGPLIVHNPAERAALPAYDEERIVVLSDYWPDSIDDLAFGLVEAPVFKFPRPADALLTNGIGACFLPHVTTPKYHITHVEPGKRYRVRIVAAGTLYAVHWRVRSHSLQLVEADGNLIEPLAVNGVEIFSGQRYSVILTANQTVDDYWMEQHPRWRAGAPPNGFAVLRYAGSSGTASLTPPTLTPMPMPVPGWIVSQFKFKPWGNVPASQSVAPTAASVTRRFVWAGSQIKYGPAQTQYRWTTSSDGSTYVMPMQATLLQYAGRNELDKMPAGVTRPHILQLNDTVEVVIQNTVAQNGLCDVHPFHLHGHSFWVVGSGPGAYDPTAPDLATPFMRDTVTLYAFNYSDSLNQSSGPVNASCGWIKIRFVADNPGTWFFHCHIAFHMVMGMAASFVTGLTELQSGRYDLGPPIPASLIPTSALSATSPTPEPKTLGFWLTVTILPAAALVCIVVLTYCWHHEPVARRTDDGCLSSSTSSDGFHTFQDNEVKAHSVKKEPVEIN